MIYFLNFSFKCTELAHLKEIPVLICVFVELAESHRLIGFNFHNTFLIGIFTDDIEEMIADRPVFEKLLTHFQTNSYQQRNASFSKKITVRLLDKDDSSSFALELIFI